MPAKKLDFILLLIMLLPQMVVASRDSVKSVCPAIKIDVERLPDLNIPRSGHQMFYAGGELMVAGGHTDGFVPTPTAEYFKDGQWHTLQMTYTHDFGLAVVLKSGKVLLAGGCEQPTGIGQTFSAEMYDPQTHTFRGFANMHQKRALASALELDSGQVVIAGNWYHDDCIELFQEVQSRNGDYKGKQSFTYMKEVAVQRAVPYIFRLADGDALILGCNSTKGDTIPHAFADRLKGDTVHIPLLESWQPLMVSFHHDEESLIGDEAQNVFTYLMPVTDSTGQVAISRVCGTEITLLPTVCAVPMQCQGDTIEYFSNVVVDRQARRAYLFGVSRSYHMTLDKSRVYVLAIDYAADSKAAQLTLYYTDPLSVTPDHAPILTPEGNLLLAGGRMDGSNFSPSSAVWLLRTGSESELSVGGFGWWLWVLSAVVLAAIILLVLWWWRRRSRGIPAKSPSQDNELMGRIRLLLEEQQLYLNTDLKLDDVAAALGLNRNYVSDCINSHTGDSFSQLVNRYRIEYAKTVLRSKPETKVTSLYMAAGFSSEQSFYRNFKAITGMTPREWIAKQKD